MDKLGSLIIDKVVDGISYVKEKGEKWINEKNDKMILEIEKLLRNEKYQNLVNEWLREDIQKLIEDGLSQLDKNKYIKDFFIKQQNLDKDFDIDSKFKANSNSLNFIIFGKKGVGKSQFINNILDLKSDNQPKVETYTKINKTDNKINETETGKIIKENNNITNLIKFTKYKNKNKKGLKLIESEINGELNFKNVLKKFDLYFNDKIISKEKNFIYGFIYLTNIDSFKEEEILNTLHKNHYGKIPIKIINVQNFTNNDFIRDILEELNENKLKKIYKYYYSLNVFKILMNKIILVNGLVNIFSSITKNENNIKNTDEATNLIINKLKLSINTLLLRPNLNYEEIRQTIKKVYSEFFKELNKDFQNHNLDYTLNEDKSFNLFDYFIENHPNDIMPIFFYEKIKILMEDIFINKIKELIIKYPFNIKKYPDYLTIRNNIKNNFIQTSNSNNLLLILIPSFILLIIIGIVIFCVRKYYFKKNKNNRNEDEGEELDNLDYKGNNE